MADRYRVDLAPAAQRQLAGLPGKVRGRIAVAIDRLAVDPRPRGVAKLAGTVRPVWRIRVGDHRIIYEVHDDRLLVLVVRIGDRAGVYRVR